MSFLPVVIRAEYRGEFKIRITFNDDSENTIDFLAWLDGPMVGMKRGGRVRLRG